MLCVCVYSNKNLLAKIDSGPLFGLWPLTC